MSNTETITRLETRICELEEKLEFYEVGNEAFKIASITGIVCWIFE